MAQGLAATPEAKKRLRVVLETLAGERPIEDACAELSLGEAGFHKMRRQALEAAAERLEGQAPGRKREAPSEDAQKVDDLQAKIDLLEVELELARYREKLALSMPYLLKRREAERTDEERGKKRSRGGRRK